MPSIGITQRSVRDRLKSSIKETTAPPAAATARANSAAGDRPPPNRSPAAPPARYSVRPTTWPSGSATMASQVSGAGLNFGMTTVPPSDWALASVASRSSTLT